MRSLDPAIDQDAPRKGGPPKPGRLRLGRGGLALAGLAASVVVAELVLRLFLGNMMISPYQLAPPDGRCVGLQPGATVRYTGWWRRVPAVQHDVNGLGFRGSPRGPQRGRGSTRTLLLGDSLVYGQAVEASAALPAQLEGRLDRGGHSVEVLNFGVSGYNLEEEVAQYSLFASRWQHDRVVLLINANDLDRPLCDLLEHPQRAWALQHFYLFRAATVVFGGGALPPDPLALTQGAQRLRDAVTSLSAEAAKHGARFYLAALEGDEILAGQQPGLESIARDQGVPYLDMRSCLPPAGAAGFVPPMIPGEGHFTPQGNAMLADCLAAWLSGPVAP